MNTMTTDTQQRPLAPLEMIPACQRCGGEADWFPPVDIVEDAEEYLFTLDLPEMKPEDIRVVVEREGLFISGERSRAWQQNRKFLRIERPRGFFERRFALPDDASRMEIKPVYKESVLELHIRKVKPLMRSARPTDALTSLNITSEL